MANPNANAATAFAINPGSAPTAQLPRRGPLVCSARGGRSPRRSAGVGFGAKTNSSKKQKVAADDAAADAQTLGASASKKKRATVADSATRAPAKTLAPTPTPTPPPSYEESVPARGPNAARLARYLAADWHNPTQSEKHPKLWSHIHSSFRPLPNSLLNGYALYAENAYDYYLRLPYKTSVVLIVEPPDGNANPDALELKSYKIKSPAQFWGGAHDRELLDGMTQDLLIELPCQCNTVYVWHADEERYVAKSRPGKGCVVRRGGTERATYVDSNITLTRDSYCPWDVGRDCDTDGYVWGGSAGPFDFIAKTRFDHEVSDVFAG